MPPRDADDTDLAYDAWVYQTNTRLMLRLDEIPDFDVTDWIEPDENGMVNIDEIHAINELANAAITDLLFQELVIEYPRHAQDLADLSYHEALRYIYILTSD